MGFEQGNGNDGKHYWLTPPDLMKEIQDQINCEKKHGKQIEINY